MYEIYGKEDDPKQRGSSNNDDAYVFANGASFKEGSDQYKEFDKLYFQTLEDPLKNANKALDIVKKIILTLEGNRKTSKDTVKGRERTTDEEVAYLIEDFNKSDASELFDLDFSKPTGRIEGDAYLDKIRGLETQITTQMAPVHNLYEALTHEKNIQKIGNLMVGAREDINTATTTVYGPTGYGSTPRTEPTVSETSVTPATTSVSAEDDPIFGASGTGNIPVISAEDDPIFGASGTGDMPIVSPEDDPIFGDFGAQADTVTVQQETQEQESEDGDGGGGGGGGGGPSLADQRAADRDEIYQLLTEQFGGASYFFRDHATNMLIGITSDGGIVNYDDPEAETQKGLMDYIVENGITSASRVKGLLQKTEWWQTTDKERRFFDVSWGEMSGPEQAEWLEPVTKALQDEAQYLGVNLSDERAFELGQMLAMEGNGDDQEEIRKILFDEDVYTGVSSEISGFAGAQDAVQQLAYTYYTPIDDDSARDWAEKIYTGESTQEEYEQFLKSTAVSRFPTLDKVINQMGVTPQQYFSPYKQQIEQMLGRQVDLLDEFSDVIEYMPDTGGTTSRPMTLSEVRNFVRATPEWQQTDDAKDQARALAFSIGQSFGEVA